MYFTECTGAQYMLAICVVGGWFHSNLLTNHKSGLRQATSIEKYTVHRLNKNPFLTTLERAAYLKVWS